MRKEFALTNTLALISLDSSPVIKDECVIKVNLLTNNGTPFGAV